MRLANREKAWFGDLGFVFASFLRVGECMAETFAWVIVKSAVSVGVIAGSHRDTVGHVASVTDGTHG
jgi:UDP-glucose 6-dehydrogenase